MHGNSSQLVTLIAELGAGLSDLLRPQGGHATGVKAQRIKGRTIGAGETAEHAFKALVEVLLLLVGDVLADLGADGSHRISAGSKSRQVA